MIGEAVATTLILDPIAVPQPGTSVLQPCRYDEEMATVLVVDDEPAVRDVIVQYLRREGFVTEEASDGLVAQELIVSAVPDLVVLDVMLPGLGGLDLCRWSRQRSGLPVILLTARGEETDRVVGLELGADDYVVKPFSPRELVARVKALLRRSGATADEYRDTPRSEDGAPVVSKVVAGGLTVDPRTREVTIEGRTVDLTAKEFDLLHFLVRHPRQVFSREQLLSGVWGFDAGAELGTSTVTVHMRRLREKIEADPSQPELLQTVWGVGYRLVP